MKPNRLFGKLDISLIRINKPFISSQCNLEYKILEIKVKKMKRIKHEFIVILGLLLLLVSIESNFVKGQDYSYRNELTVGATYDWEVKELEVSGTINTPYLDFGNEELKQGDIISVKIIQDLNELTNGTPGMLQNPANIWAEFYLNGEFMTNETDEIGLIVLDWLDFVGIYTNYFFIQPIIYENLTGTYNYFEILQNNFPQISSESTEELETHDFYGYTKMNIKQSSKLTSKSWTVILESYIEEKINDLDEPWQKTLTQTTENIEIRFNVKTGLLSFIKYDYKEHFEREIEGSIDIDDDIVFLHIESTSVPVGAPYNGIFSLFGLIAVSLVFYQKRKR